MYSHTKRVIIEVAAVIAIWCILGELLIFFTIDESLKVMLGFLLGSIIAIVSFVHMGVSLENSLDMLEEEPAKKNTVKTFIIRAVVIALVMFAAFLSGYFNLLAIVFGMFGLKVGAYAQPLVDKIFSKTK